MPVRFRRSFKIFPGVKVNMSKGGVSFTVGAKGYHLNFSKRGVRQTVGLPGSGISQTSYLVKSEPEHKTTIKADSDELEAGSEKAAVGVKNDASEQEQAVRRRGSPVWLLVLSLIVIYIGALVLGLIPSNFLSQLFHTLTNLTQGIGL